VGENNKKKPKTNSEGYLNCFKSNNCDLAIRLYNLQFQSLGSTGYVFT